MATRSGVKRPDFRQRYPTPTEPQTAFGLHWKPANGPALAWTLSIIQLGKHRDAHVSPWYSISAEESFRDRKQGLVLVQDRPMLRRGWA